MSPDSIVNALGCGWYSLALTIMFSGFVTDKERVVQDSSKGEKLRYREDSWNLLCPLQNFKVRTHYLLYVY